MEMELNKQKIKFYDKIYENATVHEESCEIIIPDSSPDMTRILSSDGRTYVKEKRIHNGGVTLTGVTSGSVLYVAEGENIIRRLEVHMPFSHTFNHDEISDNMECVFETKLINLEAREINTRKIAVRAHTAIEIACYMDRNIEITQSVAHKEEFEIETKSDNKKLYLPTFIKDRSFTIIDDIEIPQTEPKLETMLDYNVSLSNTDMKMVGNKVIIKGVAHIKYKYVSNENTINIGTHDLPYSQIIDIDDFEDKCDLSVKMRIRACDIEPMHDMTGDTRYVSVNILVDTSLVVFTKDDVLYIDDLYSTTHDVVCKFEEMHITKMHEHTNKRVAINETIETTNSVKKILDVDVIPDHARKIENKLKNDVYVQVLYVDEDDNVHSVCKRCSSECSMDFPENCEIDCTVHASGENAIGSDNQITVRFYADYDVKILCKDKIRNLELLSTGEKKTKDSEASVIIKHVYNEQPLWNIAKRYNTTVDEIANANGLEFYETVAAGSMLLIPCGK